MNRYIQHVMKLARQYGIKLCSTNDFLNSQASPFQDVVFAKPPQNYVEYAIVLHEMGHCVNKPTMDLNAYSAFMAARNPQTDSEKFAVAEEYMKKHIPMEQLMTDEIRAWNWAQTNALEWNPIMDFVREYGINSHFNRGHNKKLEDGLRKLRDSLPQFAPI